MGWILYFVIVDLPQLIFDLAIRRESCPTCANLLKYLARGKHESRVQCVMCERVWLMSKGRWLGRALRAEENPVPEVRKR